MRHRQQHRQQRHQRRQRAAARDAVEVVGCRRAVVVAVELVVRAFAEALRGEAVGAGRCRAEAVQHRQAARGGQLEHGAVVVRQAEGGAVEKAVGAEDQRAGPGAVGPAGELPEHAEAARRAVAEDDAAAEARLAAGQAARQRVAVEVAAGRQHQGGQRAMAAAGGELHGAVAAVEGVQHREGAARRAAEQRAEALAAAGGNAVERSEEHTSELQSH